MDYSSDDAPSSKCTVVNIYDTEDKIEIKISKSNQPKSKKKKYKTKHTMYVSFFLS